MEQPRSRWQYVRDLRVIFALAVGVVLAGTVIGAVTDRVHKVQAEQLQAADIKAVPAANNTQQLTVGDWSVRLTAPLAKEMPLLRYALLTPSSIGLSSADLTQVSSDCTAVRSGLGTIMRYPEGSFGASVKATPGANLVGAIDGYEYVYQFPHNACLDSPVSMQLVNQQEAVLLEAMSSLVSTKQ